LLTWQQSIRQELHLSYHVSCCLLTFLYLPNTFGTFLIVGCTNLITHALLCPIPHKLNAPIQRVMSNNRHHAQADYPVHNSFRIAHRCLNKITTSSRFVKFSNRFADFLRTMFYIKLVLWYFENHRSGFHIFAYGMTLVYTPWHVGITNTRERYRILSLHNTDTACKHFSCVWFRFWASLVVLANS